MSCGHCHSNPCSCEDVCDPNNEPLASALNNFIASFFGSISKTCVDNEVQWILPCDLNTGIAGFERRQGEGLSCYLLRLFEYLNSIVSGVTDSCFSFHNKIAINGQCYDTWQSAYDANIAAASPILMFVGKGSFGNLTLTADYNSNIIPVGFGPGISVLGNIDGTSVVNGKNVNITAASLTIGNIDCRTNDPTVSFVGGNIIINSSQDLIVGDLNTGANTGLNAGTVDLNGVLIAGNIDSNGTLGDVSIDSGCTVGTIATNGDGNGGNVTLGNNVTTGAISTNDSGPSVGIGGFVLCGKECSLGNILASGNTGGAITFGDETISGNITTKPLVAAGIGGVVTIADDCSTGNIDTSGSVAGSIGGRITIGDRCESLLLTSSGSAGGGAITIGEGFSCLDINCGSTISGNGGALLIGHRLSLNGSITTTGAVNGGSINIGQAANLSGVAGINGVGTTGTSGPISIGDGSHYSTLTVNANTAVGTIALGKFSVVGSIGASSSTTTRGAISILDGSTINGTITATSIGNSSTFTLGSSVIVTGNISIGSSSGTVGLVTVGMACNLQQLRAGSGTGSTSGITIGQATTATQVLGNTGGGVGQSAGNISLGSGCNVVDVYTNAFNPGGVAGSITLEPGANAVHLRCESNTSTGGSITLKNSNVITGAGGLAIFMGTSSTGTILALNANIKDQIDNVNGSSLFRDTVFSTPAGNRDCIANLTASGSQYTNCLFVPNGTGDSIDASVPRTIIGYQILQKNGFSANVSLSEGSETTSANLLAP